MALRAPSGGGFFLATGYYLEDATERDDSQERQTDLNIPPGHGLDERPPPLDLVLEVARLAAVRSHLVLDAVVPELDEVAEAACRELGRSGAGFGFPDEDRVWYAGAFGLQGREVARAGSFCAAALAEPVPLLVRDAGAEGRWTDGTALESGPVRFCAAAAVPDEDGYRIGALCVFGGEADDASVAELSELLQLAGTAGSLLSARRGQGRAPGAVRVQGWLGVRSRGSRLARAQYQPGLIVLSVAAGSPAAQAGVRPTDVLLSIDGQVLWHPPDVVRALAGRLPDSLVRLQIVRGGHVLERVAAVAPEPVRDRAGMSST